MNRKRLSVTLALLLAVSLAGCGSPATPNPNPTDQTPPKVVAATSTGNTTLEVTFSEAVGPEAAVAANYSVSPTLAVNTAVLSSDKTKATLTTGVQSATTYTVTVSGVKDLAGNPIDPTAKSKTFTGTPLTPGPGDSDGDGLSDVDEVAGWDVKVKKGDGSFDTRHVSSDPAKADSDGDGLSDKEERQSFTDPTSADTDQDGLPDLDELKKWGSSPTDVDSDSDSNGNPALFDGNEVKNLGTSPTLKDTDGDKITDYEEVVVRGGAFNPLIANVPQLELSLEGNTDLGVNVKYNDQTNTTKSYTTSLAQSTSTSTSSTDTQTRRVEAGVSATLGAELSAGTEGVSTKVSASVTVSAGFSNENTRSYTQDTARTSQTTQEQASSDGSVTGHTIDDGRLGVGFKVKNTGDVSFELRNLSITALLRDPNDPTQFKTVATLTPTINSITLSSGNSTKEIRADNVSIPADQALAIMANPANLFFQFSTYDLLDQEERNYEFLKENTLAQTALVVIDYGNGNVKRARVATNVERQNGQIVGVKMGKVLSDILKLPFQTQAKAGGAKVLTSLRDAKAVVDVARDPANHAMWAVVGSSNLNIPPNTDFEDILLEPNTEIHLLYVQDRDQDGLFASEEYFYGTADDKPDFDNDGLKDGEEVKTGWTVAVVGKPARKVYSNPTVADFDGDGLNDAQEKAKGTDPYKADTDGDSTPDDKDPAPLDPSVTGNRPPVINSFNASISGFVATVTASVNDLDANLSKVEIDWGDSSAKTTLTSGFAAINQTHKYGAAGTYTVKLTATDASNVSVSQQGNVQASIPRDGLLGEYLFNGNASDSSGNSKNGSITQAGSCVQASPNRNGAANKAYDFNNGSGAGCGDSNSVFGLISTANLGFSGQFSYSVWIKPSNTNSGRWILGQTDNSGAGQWAGLYIGKINNQGLDNKVSFYLTGSGIAFLLTDPNSVSTSNWTHYAVTVSASGGNTTVRLYRNGTQVASDTKSGSYTTPSTSNPFVMGNASTGGANSYFQGNIDDVRVYNRPLSDGEVQALFSVNE
ncbi:MAG TPA: LamG-like jellyroll fold domain-containing protein [Meiothermus sp.]|nr:LamG-like jellyroll fold domain-containing protein [Meiothermus sp.]